MHLWAVALGLLSVLTVPARHNVAATDSHIAYSPYNWYVGGSQYAQTANPGAYLKVGFTGSEIAVKFDVSPLTDARVPAGHYPVVRYSVDGGPPQTVQLQPVTASIPCATGLKQGAHTLLLEYVSGYVFLDFWLPVNVLRITGFALSPEGALIDPSGPIAPHKHFALFMGDSITNGDDDVATFRTGITNEVDTQDATIGYPSLVAEGLGAEYGVVAYGGASWDGTAADGHTPGIMQFFAKFDDQHSRLVNGKLSPTPDDVFINMGENSGPSDGDVPKLLAAIRAASSSSTNIFLIVPFSGRSRGSLTAGFADYRRLTPGDSHVHMMDLGNCPYLTDRGPTMLSVDGQHPLAGLHARLAGQIIAAYFEATRPRR